MNEHDALRRKLERLPMEPENGELYNDIGVMLYELGDFADARAYLAAARELRPPDAVILFNHARALYACRDWAKAEETLREYLQAQPQDQEALALMADACYLLGDYGAAASWQSRGSIMEEGK